MSILEQKVKGTIIGGAVGDAFGVPMEGINYLKNLENLKQIENFEDYTDEILKKCEDAGSFIVSKEQVGKVTDDTVLADVLLDCIFENNGDITGYDMVNSLLNSNIPVKTVTDEEIKRSDWIYGTMKIGMARAAFPQVNKRDAGSSSIPCTDGIMIIAPIGALCAGDPYRAEYMALDILSPTHNGSSRDIAAGYAAAIAASFNPRNNIQQIVQTALTHTRDELALRKIYKMVELSYKCNTIFEYIDRYWDEIVGKVVPLQDEMHYGGKFHTTWDACEVMGIALSMFIISKADAYLSIKGASLIGRDADTNARVVGGLVGAYCGINSIPEKWSSFVLQKNSWLDLDCKAIKLSNLIRDRYSNCNFNLSDILF